MQTLQDMERKLKSADDLHTVVRTMKSLAAVSIRQYEDATRSLDEYFQSVEMGLLAALRRHPLVGRQKDPRKTLIMVFGSDQGMAGRFNEAIIEFVQVSRSELEVKRDHPLFWVAGAKAHGLMEDTFGEVHRFISLPPSVEGVSLKVQEILLHLAEVREKEGELRLILFHNRPAGGSSYRQQRVNLLPPDQRWLKDLGKQQWPSRQIPLYTMPWEELFAALIGEYLFVALFRAFAASMAAENAARLASMQRAEKNIEETTEEMTREFHSMRQNTISEELFDVISGFEALSASDDGAQGT
ncbi:MAG: F0F1 ATP synthase subunit gamma [Desulfuromonadales bacterium]